MDAWFAPVRSGGVPPYAVKYAGAPIHSASASKSDTSIVVPSPLAPRAMSAVRMAEYAYIPAAMSATEMPTLHGAVSVPVMETRPTSLWTSRSYAFLWAYAPHVPYPDTLHTIRR